MLQEKAVVCGLQDQACSPRVTGGSLQVPGCRRKPPLVDYRKHDPDEMKGAPFDAGSRPAVRGLQNEACSFAGCRSTLAARRSRFTVRGLHYYIIGLQDFVQYACCRRRLVVRVLQKARISRAVGGSPSSTDCESTHGALQMR